jgi:hypothetical protein
MNAMKRKLVFLLSFVFYVFPANAQDLFTVIKVSGKIVIERTGSPLGIGTSFAQNENLLFKIPESRAAVINPRMGRFLITANNVNEFRNAKSNYLPAPGRMSTRAIEQIYDPGDLARNIKDDYIILNRNKVLVDTSIYPMSAEKYFYISYDLNEKTINKKLSFNADTLIILKKELLTVDGKELSSPEITYMKLIYYLENGNFTNKNVSVFAPVFPDINTLKQELKIITDQMELKPYEEVFKEIKTFLSEFYGNIDETDLKIWLKENFGLRQ